MPYTVMFDDFFDSTFTITWAAVVGGLWVPPPPEGSSPGPPAFAGTVTSGSGESAILTFPTLDGPPTSESAMLISEPSFGDLYRLASGPPSANPAHLSGDVEAGSPLGQNDLDNLTATIGPETVPVPAETQVAFGAASLGGYIPTSITVSGFGLTLPTTSSADGTLNLTLTGTIAASHWGLWTGTSLFTFTETVTLAPSGDPVDPSRILAATGSGANMSIPGGWVLTPLLAPVMAGRATPALEASFNQAIVSKVNGELAKQNKQLSPGAVISAKKPVITPSGITLTVSVANIFGPALMTLENTSVPNVIGDDVPTAQKAMATASLYFEEQKGVSSPRLQVPTVVKTTSTARTAVPKGTSVTCVVDYPDNSQ